MRTAITIALRARGRVTGALTLGVAWSGRHYRPDDARFTRVLAGRIALALDNAGLFSDLGRSERARAEIAETLQRGLLPSPLPHIPGWSAAAMYRPAGAENEVGGDFYDAFPVAGGWMVVIGDVTGRGARAASITAQARYTLRTAAVLTGDPLVALATLNRALLARRDSALCSVAALSLSEEPLQPVRLAVAGHPPPLLVDGEAVTETGAPGRCSAPSPMPAGTWSTSRSSRGSSWSWSPTASPRPAAPDGRFGEERLHAELAGATSPVLAVQRLEGALHAFTEGVLDDDAAMLAIARPRAGPARTPAPRSSAATAGGGLGWSGDDESDRIWSSASSTPSTAATRRGSPTLCDERMEFFPVTAEEIGRTTPYVGPEGLREYLGDIARVWEELLILPKQVEGEGDRLLVRGRVYLRSRKLGIRDMPAAWIWELDGGRFVRGEVFADPEQASLRFATTSA